MADQTPAAEEPTAEPDVQDVTITWTLYHAYTEPYDGLPDGVSIAKESTLFVTVRGPVQALALMGDRIATFADHIEDGVSEPGEYPYSARQLRRYAERFPNPPLGPQKAATAV